MDVLWNLIYVVLGVVLTVLIGYLLDKPKLVLLLPIWKRRKWVTTHGIDPVTKDRVLIHGDHYYFYGITIRNQHSWIPRTSADISSTTLKIWDSQGKVIGVERQCRWWTVDHASIDPLFIGNKADIEERRRRTIGTGAEENVVLFYRQEQGSDYYRFTVATDTLSGFPVSDDALVGGIAPYHALLRIRGNRIEKTFHLLVSVDQESKDISAQIEREFPFEVEE